MTVEIAVTHQLGSQYNKSLLSTFWISQWSALGNEKVIFQQYPVFGVYLLVLLNFAFTEAKVGKYTE